MTRDSHRSDRSRLVGGAALRTHGRAGASCQNQRSPEQVGRKGGERGGVVGRRVRRAKQMELLHGPRRTKLRLLPVLRGHGGVFSSDVNRLKVDDKCVTICAG